MAEDLRLEDNLAFAMASKCADDGLAVVRIAPEARGRPRRTPLRLELEDAAERRIGKQLGALGIAFELVGPENIMSLAATCRRLQCTSVIRNAADGMAIENGYRIAWEQELQSANIPFLTVNGEMIRRLGPGGAKPDRPFLSDDRLVESDKLPEDHPILLLRAFLQELPERNYLADMWTPGRDRASSSLLSTHFAAGTLSSDRAIWETVKAERLWKAANPDRSRSTEGASFRHFRSRIGMRTGFMTLFSRYQDKTPHIAFNDAQEGRVRAWREGRTGIPMPDAAMRELATTGWINFRLRQLVTSYGVQLLQLPAAEVGGALAEMFNDYEPGITWLQVGLNDGTIMQDRGPRILNPVKQGHDLDPSETYIRHWLPELETVPAGFGHEPWLWLKNPLPAPMVDHKAAYREARRRWGGKDQALVPRGEVTRTHGLPSSAGATTPIG
ncbi:MAG: FAD-binding domain-containing protein [Sphingobium sp.]|uniref:FAD-binding domain-containing protein n=1 Tax=Sphingobium sp. TaxID=1912891 RepID=UPI0029B18D86|nr:FAD-binding domain-containing protein [Sphingobium sp.]MDX3910402.1 FAD-binding domain-containing protein [Sphingobium sp.]